MLYGFVLLSTKRDGFRVNHKAIKYSIHYFISISLYSIVLGFFPLYCKDLGFSSFQIAMVAASATAATVLGTPVLLQIAHHWVAPRILFPLGAFAAFLSFLCLFPVTSFLPLLLVWFICIFVKRGSDSLVDAQTLRDSSKKELRFEAIRMWGSIGFVVTSSISGYYFDLYGSWAVLPIGAGVLLLIFLWSLILSPLLPIKMGKSSSLEFDSSLLSGHSNFRSVFIFTVLSLALVSASHASLYSYLSLYLRALGWSGALISAAWNIGVISEIVLFLLFFKLEARLPLSRIFQLSIAATILRWLILSGFDSKLAILSSQILHAFSFGGCYIASLKLVHQSLPEHLKDRGQGSLIALGQGMGSLVGYFLAGFGASLLATDKDLHLLFIGSAIVAILSLIVSLRLSSLTKTIDEQYQVKQELDGL